MTHDNLQVLTETTVEKVGGSRMLGLCSNRGNDDSLMEWWLKDGMIDDCWNDGWLMGWWMNDGMIDDCWNDGWLMGWWMNDGMID